MIDKIQPRKLDKDTDQKLVQKTAMVDALNVYIDERLSGSEGDAGVIKPILGTDSVLYASNDANLFVDEEGEPIVTDEEAGTVAPVTTGFRVLGSVVDNTTDIVYFFVWSDNADEQGVYAYDSQGSLGSGANVIHKIFAHKILNFQPQSFISADVIHKTPGSTSPIGATLFGIENDAILYFTDGVNEPRKIDVYKSWDYVNSGIYDRDRFNLNDYVCACPKVPMGNVDFEFDSDTSKLVNNFESSPGLQFSIQGVYYDGATTAMGPYSSIAFSPSVVNRGSRPSVDSLKYNRCKIIVPPLPDEIEFVKILFRQGNSANFSEIAEVPNFGSDASDPNWINTETERHYNFYNNTIALGVSPSEVSKIFDAVPRTAHHETTASNRLVYGNFVEGYDRSMLHPSIFPVYKDRPSEGVDFVIGAIPSLVYSNLETVGERNISSGIEIDVSEIPDEIGAGAVIEFAFSVAPDRNYHVYDSTRSYHQTRARGWRFSNVSGYPTSLEGIGDTSNVLQTLDSLDSPAGIQERGSQKDGTPFANASSGNSNGTSGDEYLGPTLENYLTNKERVETTRLMWGKNYGVGRRLDGNSSQTPLSDEVAHGDDNQYQAGVLWLRKKYGEEPTGYVKSIMSYGTSAANPFIIHGGAPLEFRLKFKFVEDVTDGKYYTSKFVHEYMGGLGNPFPDLIEVDEEGTSLEFDYELDLGLSNKQQLPVTDFRRNLIVACRHDGPADSYSEENDVVSLDQAVSLDEMKRNIPASFFIFNKGSVKFSLEAHTEGKHLRRSLMLRINDIHVDADEGIYTCMRKPDPGSPWWTFSPDFIDSHVSDADTKLAELDDELSYFSRMFDNSNFRFNLSTCLQNTGSFGYSYNSRAFSRPLWKERDSDNWGGNAREIWPCKIDSSNNKSRFSLVDGEAGPGGKNPGEESAFEVFRNARQGSVTGQVLFTHHGITDRDDSLSVEDVRNRVRGDISKLLPFKSFNDANLTSGGEQLRRQSVMLGGQLYLDNDDQSFDFIDFGTLGPVTNYGAAAASGVQTAQYLRSLIGAGGGSPNDFPAMAVFSGPFFTGRIDCNPIMSPQLSGSNLQTHISERLNSDGELNYPQCGMESFARNWNSTSSYSFMNGGARDGNTLNVYDNTRWLPRRPCLSTVLPFVVYTDLKDQAKQSFKHYGTNYAFPILDESADDEVAQGFSDGSISYDDYVLNIEVPVNNNALNGRIFNSDLYDADGAPFRYMPGHQSVSFTAPSYGPVSPHIEVVSSVTNVSTNSGKPIMSFKSNATHEFGVVYFDERGRRGPVNYIGSVYVPGYSEQERGNAEGGPVYVRIDLQSTEDAPPPPSWAHHYKIVYSKNTSVSEFFQYSTEGAYVIDDDSPSAGEASKIYMSLNYLQGHPISYSDAWGARSQQGSPVVFQPESGDKLRVISYNSISGGEEGKIFPASEIFDVVGVESLGEENNPLFEDAEDPRYHSKQGLFLILRDNPESENFSARAINNGASFWNNNVIFEVFRPIKELDEEKRLYFEIGPTYSIGRDEEDGRLFHLNEDNEEGPIELAEGDVFFRLSAVNQKEISGPNFKNLITEAIPGDDGSPGTRAEPQPNFKGIYLESSSASDLFKSDAISIGRPAKIDPNDRERIRTSSLIHGDKDLMKKRKLGYSSFNPSQADDRDLEQVHGDINYLAFTDDSIMVLQEKKVSHIPVDRNIISTADNNPSLVASSNVLGTARYYAGVAGTDAPESVSIIDSAAYFVSKSLGKVFRSSGSNGVMDISAKSMSTFFRELLNKAASSGYIMKFFGGHDPKKDEYLITSKELVVKTPTGEAITQSDSPPQTFSEAPAQQIVIGVNALEAPAEYLNNAKFTSTLVVPVSEYYAPCCFDDPFEPVAIAINAISEGLGVFLEINSTITANLTSLINANQEVTVGQLNSLITNSIAAEGIVDDEGNPIIVAPFSVSSGTNIYYNFLTDCDLDSDPFAVQSVNQFEDWYLNVFGGPDILDPLAYDTGFRAVEFVENIKSRLESPNVCSIPYTGQDSLLSEWNGVLEFNKVRDHWDAEGNMLETTFEENGNVVTNMGWSTFVDNGGTFPSVIKNRDELITFLVYGRSNLAYQNSGQGLRPSDGESRFMPPAQLFGTSGAPASFTNIEPETMSPALFYQRAANMAGGGSNPQRLYDIPTDRLNSSLSQVTNTTGDPSNPAAFYDFFLQNQDGEYVFNGSTPIIGSVMISLNNAPLGVDTTVNPGARADDASSTGAVYGVSLHEIEPIVREALINYGGDPAAELDAQSGLSFGPARPFKANGFVVYRFEDYADIGGGGVVFGEDGDGELG